MNYLQVSLEPVDPLLFGDNRMARAGEDHILTPQLPSPYTIFGAIGQFLANRLGAGDDLSHWEAQVQECLGEFIDDSSPDDAETMELLAFVYQTGEGEFYFPAPRHYQIFERNKKYFTPNIMMPMDSPGLSNCVYSKVVRGKNHPQKIETDFLIDQNTLGAILAGLSPKKPAIRFFSDIFVEEFRSGLAMDNNRNVTKEAHLFNRPYWRFLGDYSWKYRKWTTYGIAGWVKLLCDNDLKGTGVGFLGGDRRRAIFVLNDDKNIPFLDLQSQIIANLANTDGFFIYLVTALPLEKGLEEFDFLGRGPCAAAIGKPIYISGWERTRNIGKQRPRPMVWAVPAGSVFFFKWENNENSNEGKKRKIITENWLKSIAPKKYRRFGFGRIFIGVWKNGDSN